MKIRSNFITFNFALVLAVSITSLTAAPGDLDPTFGSGGKVITTYGTSVDRTAAVLVTSGGKVLVVGSAATSLDRVAMVRYNSSGSLDTSFGAGGKVASNLTSSEWMTAHAARLQPDGKIVVAGVLDPGGGFPKFFLMRFSANGTIDETFSNDGYVIVNFDDTAAEIVETGIGLAIQSDGKIVMAGTVSNATFKIGIARFNSDGSPDSSFWSDGTKVYEENSDVSAGAVAVDGSGRILAAGVRRSGSNRFGIIRIFNSDGSHISNHYFNWMSWIFSDPSIIARTFFNSIAIDGTGKIVIAGRARGNDGSDDFLTARFHPDGNLDTSFNYAGYNVDSSAISLTEEARSLAIQADGKIVAAGVVEGDIGLVRLTSAGVRDSTFGSNGWKTVVIGGSGGATGLAVDSSGKMLVAGPSQPLGDFLTVRFNPNGSLDSTFNPAGRTYGWVSTNLGEEDYIVRGFAIQPDGKLVAAVSVGSQVNSIRLVRYDPDGSLDSTFGSNGRLIAPNLCFNGTSFSNELPTAIEIQSDGKILVGARATGACAIDTDFALARFMSDGSLDVTFGNGGSVFTDFFSGKDAPSAIALQEDGKIVVVGTTIGFNQTRSDFAIARYNSNGTVDTTFSSDGRIIIPFGNYSSYAVAVAVQPTHLGGKIVIGGYDTTVVLLQQQHDFAVARLNSNGTMDAQFGTAGKLTTQFGSLDSRINDLVLFGTKIVAVGHARNSATGSDFAIARYNLNGTLDTTFDTDGKVTTSFGSFNDEAYGVAIQSDGKIVVAGTGHSSGESKDNFALARYLTNGSLDTTFNLDGKLTTSFTNYGIAADGAKSLVIQPDGKLVAAGNTFTGVNYNIAIARYEP